MVNNLSSLENLTFKICCNTIIAHIIDRCCWIDQCAKMPWWDCRRIDGCLTKSMIDAKKYNCWRSRNRFVIGALNQMSANWCRQMPWSTSDLDLGVGINWSSSSKLGVAQFGQAIRCITNYSGYPVACGTTVMEPTACALQRSFRASALSFHGEETEKLFITNITN